MKILMNWWVNSIFVFIFIFYSCSEKWIMDIDPKDYEFENEYIQMKWEYFLKLEDCEKIYYLDSIYRPILEFDLEHHINNKNIYFDSALVTNKPKQENYYYWMFREIHRITQHWPSIIVTHYYGYGSPNNNQNPPYYFPEDSLMKYNKDIQAWKDSLNCD